MIAESAVSVCLLYACKEVHVHLRGLKSQSLFSVNNSNACAPQAASFNAVANLKAAVSMQG